MDIDDVVRKTKRRKYGKDPCDFVVGVEKGENYDGTRLPRRIICGTNRTKYIKELSMWGEFLCDKHFEVRIERLRDDDADV